MKLSYALLLSGVALLIFSFADLCYSVRCRQAVQRTAHMARLERSQKFAQIREQTHLQIVRQIELEEDLQEVIYTQRQAGLEEVAASFVVIGAGNRTANGQYIVTGSFNGKPVYKKHAGQNVWWIFWRDKDKKWVFWTDTPQNGAGQDMLCVYQNSDDTGVLPTSAWQSGQSPFAAPPTPVILTGANLALSTPHVR